MDGLAFQEKNSRGREGCGEEGSQVSGLLEKGARPRDLMVSPFKPLATP